MSKRKYTHASLPEALKKNIFVPFTDSFYAMWLTVNVIVKMFSEGFLIASLTALTLAFTRIVYKNYV